MLDWESPAWVSVADVIVGDASSANIEAVMAGKPTVLLPVNNARSVSNTDAELADVQLRMQQSAAHLAHDARTLAMALQRHSCLAPDQSIISYFNAYFGGQARTRGGLGALDGLASDRA